MKEREKMFRMVAGILACTMSVGVMGCGERGVSASTQNLTDQYRQENEENAGADGRQDTADSKRDAGVTPEFACSYADFSLNLLRESRYVSGKTDDAIENTMVSPLSVMLALEMTRQGARGETRDQMDAVLYPGITAEEGMSGLLTFTDRLPNTEDTKFHLANSIWLNTTDEIFTPSEDFLRKEAAEYDAHIFGAPFDKQTCADLNRWVSRETDGMVEDILEKIPEDAVMYLVNATAFEAEWMSVYEADQVHDALFYAADGSEATVSMMYDELHGYLSGENVQGFRKAYKDGYDFVALLPDEGIPLEEYLAGLDGETFLETIAEDNDTMVETGLPKFEGQTKMELSEMLKNMGMPLAFDALEADFTGMGSCTDDYRLCISRVLHQTYVKVDERGTKAGASTVVEMVAETAMLMEEEPKRVILDRPFLYAIVEEETGLPVFIGTVEKL